jgi:hypothetical protein
VVTSSSIVVAADGEHLACGGFSLNEIIRLGNFDFIADYFGSLSLSPSRGDEGVAFMGSTHHGASTPQWAMIEDSTEDGFKRGMKLRPPFPQKAQRQGLTHRRHNHNIEGERSGHDDVYPMDGSAMAEN